jgi:hypothetical protein
MAAPLALSNGTLLVLTPLSGASALQLTPYAARGLTQTLELLTGAGGQSGGWLRRDVNGWLRSTADTRFRKYKSEISCKDGETPCLDGAWIGEVVEVSCACELSYPTGATPQRPAVSSSTHTQGTITYYRPLLTMMVSAIRIGLPEYQGVYEWQVSLEEV